MENVTLSLITPPPQELLSSWLAEMRGKPVEIERRQVLRHRDLSFVERLWLKESLPRTLIYKVVLPPWDIEKILYQKVLISSVSNSPALYYSKEWSGMTAMFVEDCGQTTLTDALKKSPGLPSLVGHQIAGFHEYYAGEVGELCQSGLLSSFMPADFASLSDNLAGELRELSFLNQEQIELLYELGEILTDRLGDEPLSLIHGDLYAENLLFDGEHLFIIDWSWFARISIAILDLATVTMDHFKNGDLVNHRSEVIEAYCARAGRDFDDISSKLPYAEMLSRLLFLEWLAERRRRGILGTTVGPVEIVMGTLVSELKIRLRQAGGHANN